MTRLGSLASNRLHLWCAVLMLLGVLMIAASVPMTAFKDEARAREIISEYGPTDEWHEKAAAQRTNKWLLQDRGTSLLLLGGTAPAIMWWGGMRRHSGWRRIQTPARRPAFFIVGIAAVWWLWKSDEIELRVLLGRGSYFPSWADSIGIPLSFSLIFFTMLGVVAVVGMAFVLWKARLPVPLWYWDSRRPFRSRAWNVAFSVPIVVAALLTVDSMLFGMGVGVPAHLIVLYLLLSGRAIMVAKGGFLSGEFEAAIGYDPAKKAKDSA